MGIFIVSLLSFRIQNLKFTSSACVENLPNGVDLTGQREPKMEKRTDSFPGVRNANLKRSFNLSVHSLLTSCSKEQFSAAFSRFSGAEQMLLRRLFIQDEFESFCLETEVDGSLDSVEQLIEECHIDPLFADLSNLSPIGEDLLVKKKNEIQYLKHLIEKVCINVNLFTPLPWYCFVRARVEQLKETSDGLLKMA